MAKKGVGPKEAQLRDMRQSSNGILDVFAEFEAARTKAIEQLQAKRQELETERDQLTSEIDAKLRDVDSALAKMGVDTGRGEKSSKSTGKGRRSEADCKADAARIVSYIKSNPNAKGKVIKEVVADFGQSLSDFLEKYAPEAKLKKHGDKISTTWSIE